MTKKNISDQNRFFLLAKYVKPFRRSVLTSVVFHVFAAVFTVFSIPLIKPFFELLFKEDVQEMSPPLNWWNFTDQLNFFFHSTLVNHGKERALVIVCITLSLSFLFKNISRYLASYFITPVRNGVVANIRKALFEKYVSMPMSFYSEEKKGNLITRMSTDITEIEHSILNVLEGAFKAPFIIVGAFLFMIFTSWKLTFFVLILLVVVGLIVTTISKNLKQQSNDAQNAVSSIVSLLEETIGGIKVLKAFSGETYQLERFEHQNDYYKNKLTSLLRKRDLASPLSEFLSVTIVSVLMYYGAHLVFAEQLEPATFFAFIFAFYTLVEPTKLLSNAFYNLQKGMASVERIEHILSIENQIANHPGHLAFPREMECIEFKNISFKYKEDQTSVLKNINLSFSKNKVNALVGLSGSGKTTLSDLIPRFYDATSGDILFGGVNIKEIKLSELREQIGLVSQDAILFNDTIEQNIRFGNKKASLEEVIAASKMANAHEFILELEQGYQSNVGDRGMKLSGGQKQRITLARAILKNPSILILDEATSALDAKSEKLVQAALEEFVKGRTTISIAHRLSTIQAADTIFVLRDGILIESGNHDELIQNKGEYYRFVQLQNLNT